MAKIAIVILAVAMMAMAVSATQMRGVRGPLHASCNLDWVFPNDNCQNVTDMIVAQAKKMSGSDCGSGEKCNYDLKSSENGTIKLVHSTPVKHYKDDLTITMTNWASGDSHCDVHGYSTSETWYAVLDYGTNYCNLHNLVEDGGLKFTETASDSTCTQYSSANCDKY